MAKIRSPRRGRNTLQWLKEMLGIEKPKTPHPRSIVERLEGLVPPVDLIEKSYKVDRHIAEAHHNLLLAAEKLTVATLEKQQHAIETSELLLDQQEVTAGIIETQVDKAANADTIINNFKIFLTEDELTIQWILENIIDPSVFAAGFGRVDPQKQRKLFNALGKTVNNLQKEDGMLAEPPPPLKPAPGGV